MDSLFLFLIMSTFFNIDKNTKNLIRSQFERNIIHEKYKNTLLELK